MNLERFGFLGISRNFSASIGSFQGLPAELSEVILLSQRLALKYNTTPPAFCQHFLASFFLFFQILFSPGSVRLFFFHSAPGNQQAQTPELPSSAPAPLGQTLQFASGCAIIIYTLYCAAKEAPFHDPHRQHRQHPYHCGRLRPRHTPVLRSAAF